VRGGGIAIGSGITVATVLAMIWNIVEHGAFGLGGIILPIGFLVLTWCYSAIGMSDDLDSLRPIGRLIGQLVLALLFGATIAMFSTQGIAHVLAFAVIGVGTVNAVNFVDGLNGFVTEWVIITAGWFAFVGTWIGDKDLALLRWRWPERPSDSCRSTWAGPRPSSATPEATGSVPPCSSSPSGCSSSACPSS
jgi:UDP-GlcNAc:undecaprenyl-phosphate GlcNAc-1-phosphate transferase